MKDASSVIFLGRHVGFPVAMEGALKQITCITLKASQQASSSTAPSH